jgi:predicted Zn-dependent protease
MPVYSENKKNIEQANAISKQGHEAYLNKDYLKAGKLYDQAYKINKIAIYKENSLTAYLNYITELANNEQYDEAISFALELLKNNPENKTLKEILSDVYFSRSSEYFYGEEIEKSRLDSENSMKYSILDEQKNRATERLEQIKMLTQKEFKTYTAPDDNSIQTSLDQLESKLYKQTFNSLPILQRIENLEKAALGQLYTSDSLVIRIDRLKKTLIAQYTSNINNPDNYINEIIEQSIGHVDIFREMPIKVYFNDPDKLIFYKNIYKQAVIEGFGEWEKACNKIRFKIVESPMEADLQVKWQSDFEDYNRKPVLKTGDINKEKERLQYQKAGAIVKIGSMAAMITGGLFGIPIIGSIGSIGNSLASPYLSYKGTNFENKNSEIKINTAFTKGMPDEESAIKIKQIAIHQMGHALGICGHSNDPGDIMYTNFTTIVLSNRDINTINEIYKQK